MKFSEQWCRKWVNPEMNTVQFCEQLTSLGLEVDTVESAALSFNKVVVGKIIAKEKHPSDDGLNVCRVDVGAESYLNIICGASNLKQGLKVAVVLVGGVLRGRIKIQQEILQGEVSDGMICSGRELGLSEEDDGILELPSNTPVGLNLQEYFQLDDQIINIDLTPNRGDCLSIRGIARDVAAVNNMKITWPDWAPAKNTIKNTLSIQCESKKACPRYLGRVIQDINTQAKTPLWMRERLRRSGIRAMHPVLDITNYVMLEMGQPLYAFDLQKIDQKIIIRMAKKKERFTLLDGDSLSLTTNTLVIADAKKPQAIAGVIGGKSAAVNEKTEKIFLESAFFSPDTIAASVRHYGLQTEASYRFERGVDFNLQRIAMERATQLIVDIMGGNVGPISETVSKTHLPQSLVITLRYSQIKRLLGVEIDKERIEAILSALGMSLKRVNMGWEVIPPSYRFDITLEYDLIAEIARLYGYDLFPEKRMESTISFPTAYSQSTLMDFTKLLTHRDYHEAISYSFVSPELENLINPKVRHVVIQNPLTCQESVMRTSLWSGLLQALQYNQNRKIQRVRLFESGLCFSRKNNEKNYDQTQKLGGLVSGDVNQVHWNMAAREVDFYDIKGDIEALLALTGQPFSSFFWNEGEHAALHPGRSSAVYYQKQCIAHVGALHPGIVNTLGLQNTVYLFEINYSMIEPIFPSYQSISKFPAVQRDLSIILRSTVPVELIKRKIVEYGNNLLNEVRIFDVYQGKPIEVGKKSVALNLTFHHVERTLQEQEVNDLMEHILQGLRQALHAELRI